MKQYYSSMAIFLPFCLSFVATMLFLFKIKKDVKKKSRTENNGKKAYTTYTVLIGTLSGTLVFYSLVSIFNLSAGHGLGYIIILFEHILFSSVMIILGRIIIGWKNIVY